MKLNKLLNYHLSIIYVRSIFLGNEILANHFSNNVEYDMHNENQLLVCGGGGGGGGGGVNQAFKN